MADPAGRRRRETYAERRERRAAIDDPAVVLDAALRFLETRSRSVSEVRRRLTAAGYRTALVEAAVDRLLDIGILDDGAFARAWVESRDRSRPRGAAALRRELRLKGIDGALIDEVLAERGGEADTARGAPHAAAPDAAAADAAAAERLLARHARALARVTDPRKRRQRAYALLARNGFDPDTANDALRQFLVREATDEPGAAEE